LVYIAV
jgi:hypothetical protein